MEYITMALSKSKSNIRAMDYYEFENFPMLISK